jgi:hypothetical protein
VQRLLQSKILTTQEAAARISAIDADADKKKRALELQQFQRNQKIQTAQALINGAMGVTAALAAMPGAADIISLGAFRALQIGFTVATTAAQVAVINSQKPVFGKGGFLPGPSHSEGGLPIINPKTGQKVAEVEGEEVILSKNTVRNNSTVVGALLHSSMYRNGTSIQPFHKTRPLNTLNYSAINTGFRKYAVGGQFSAPAGQGGADQGDALSNMMFMQLAATIEKLHDRLDIPFTGYVQQKQIDDSNTRKAQILSDAKIA